MTDPQIADPDLDYKFHINTDLARGATAKTVRAARTAISLNLPDDLDFEEWAEVGLRLNHAAASLAWWIADWWAYGAHRYGERIQAVRDLGLGLSVRSCMTYASVARKFETSRRLEVLSFGHHAEVAALPPDEANSLLAWAAEPTAKGGPARPIRELREEKQRRAEEKQRVTDHRDCDDDNPQPAPPPGSSHSTKPRQKKAPPITVATLFGRPREEEEWQNPLAGLWGMLDDWVETENKYRMHLPDLLQYFYEHEVADFRIVDHFKAAEQEQDPQHKGELQEYCTEILEYISKIEGRIKRISDFLAEVKNRAHNYLSIQEKETSPAAATLPQDPPKQDKPADTPQPTDKVQQRFRTLPESRQVREDE
jgi:hypothetical protein